MTTSKNSFVKGLKLLALVLVFVFASNTNATAATSVASSNTVSLTANVIPGAVAIIGKKYKKKKKYKKNCKPRKKKKRRKKIPVDGGLSLLAIGAAAYGTRKLWNNKK